MLNKDYKQQAINDLKKTDMQYMKVFKKAILDIERLQQIRIISVKTIQYIERYIIALANRPRNYDIKIGEIKIRYVKFINIMKEIQELQIKQQEKCYPRNTGITGALIGTGTTAFSSSIAMAVAMIFGTTSTETAIASLSGAATTNAALAWLGGGAIATGGRQALTTGGPLDWIINGVSLGKRLIEVNLSNKEIATKAEKSISIIKKEIERLKEIDAQVISWNNETKILSNKLMQQLNRLKMNRKIDYNQFTENELNELVSLINSAEVLSKKIGETI